MCFPRAFFRPPLVCQKKLLQGASPRALASGCTPGASTTRQSADIADQRGHHIARYSHSRVFQLGAFAEHSVNAWHASFLLAIQPARALLRRRVEVAGSRLPGSKPVLNSIHLALRSSTGFVVGLHARCAAKRSVPAPRAPKATTQHAALTKVFRASASPCSCSCVRQFRPNLPGNAMVSCLHYYPAPGAPGSRG